MAGSLLVRRRRRASTNFRLHKPKWIDPFPAIPGTEPEKRVFAALVQRGIYFVYQGQIPELERGLYTTMAIAGYKPDFLLPQYRLIIDPFSPFHHSLEEAVQRDTLKYGTYLSLGYRFYFPWALSDGVFILDQGGFRLIQGRFNLRGKFIPDPDQKDQQPRVHEFEREILRSTDVFLSGRKLQGAQALLSAIPELAQPPKYDVIDKRDKRNIKAGIKYRIGEYVGAGATSVAAANRKRRRPPHLTLSFGRRRKKRQRSL